MQIDYQTVFEHLPTPAAYLRDRVIVACNPPFMAVMRGDETTLIGRSFGILYAAEQDFDQRGQRVEQVLRRTGTYSDDWLLKRLNGEIFWCHISGKTLDRQMPYRRAVWTFVDLSAKRQVDSPIPASLTQRERDVATLLLEGLSSKAIARRLAISPRTVDIYRGSLLRKYQVNNTAELLASLVRH